MIANRSWLFAPGDDERKIARAAQAGADAVIFDLEDAVTAARRPASRVILGSLLAEPSEGGGERWVRVNPLDSPDALADLTAVVKPHLDGIVLPKITRAADVTTLDHYVSALEAREGIELGSIGIMVVATETPEMMFRLGDLAGSSGRLQACTWGAEDLATALGAASNKSADGDWDGPYQLARSLCLFAAGAAGIQPVDTLFAAFGDDDGLMMATRLARRQGFTGKIAIHPRQVPIINEHMSPSADEVADAEAVVAAFAAQADAGTVSLDGRMLDRPHLTQAERVLARGRDEPMTDGTIVWTPRPATSSGLARFAESLRRRGVIDAGDYRTLWRWSIEQPADFWTAIADDAGIVWRDEPSTVLRDASMPGATWFPDGSLNYVDLALRRRDDEPALIFQQEDGNSATLSWNELAEQVRLAAAGLRRLGVSTGDRVAAYLPSRVETVVAFLAAASLGAIWTATSPDFGERSVLDRFQQVEPRVLLAVSGYTYNGRWHDRREVVARLGDGLPSVEHVVALPGGDPIDGAVEWSSVLAPTDTPLTTVAVPFDHPLWVVYTSGTTGRPKSIVHGHGGVMLEHHKLLRLHLDLTTDDRFFWFSTTGWVMWNIVVGGLLVGVPIVIYDGSPTYPGPERLWDLAADTRATFLGLSAGFIHNAMREDHHPHSGRDLSAVRSVGVTGSPLAAAGYGWLLDRLGRDVFIASISGGTDVATAFVGCTPSLPIRAGSLQTACLGVDAVALDEAGNPVVGATGELVIRQPIPSMPVSFWGDDDGERYRSSYFDVYPGQWRHGDWVRFDADGSCVVFGRSDATLNRGGVRMGTGDFYSVLDAMASVGDALVIDTTSVETPDGRLVLLVQPADGVVADDTLAATIRTTLRTALSPRHNPDDVVFVEHLPRTLNGKRLEVPAKRLFMGGSLDEAVDVSAVDDPAALRMLADAAAAWRASASPTTT